MFFVRIKINSDCIVIKLSEPMINYEDIKIKKLIFIEYFFNKYI